MKDVQICEYILTNEEVNRGKVAILRGGVNVKKPIELMNAAVSKYVGNDPFNEFVEIHMDNPWVRVIVSNINNLDYKDFENQRLNG